MITHDSSKASALVPLQQRLEAESTERRARLDAETQLAIERLRLEAATHLPAPPPRGPGTLLALTSALIIAVVAAMALGLELLGAQADTASLRRDLLLADGRLQASALRIDALELELSARPLPAPQRAAPPLVAAPAYPTPPKTGRPPGSPPPPSTPARIADDCTGEKAGDPLCGLERRRR